MPTHIESQPPISNEDLAAQIAGVEARLSGRLDSLEGTVKDSGLNGHSPLLKSFLEQYAATYQSRQAWLTVRSDLSHRLRFLTQPRAWLRAFFYAVLGGLGWQVVSHFPPHVPHF